ncbi:transcription factor bHLH162-like isoform X2 [Rhodamnia argentea]|uniref:Transcription factor bHLH162-like isoform X2 n=1 Tax=Rhodamnia argentea TaxID=178133 RepID=A0A8B8NHT9_9MYRT|nr:transcription factor bHLH162-like isoform X2 [Rhodamnia argentea]
MPANIRPLHTENTSCRKSQESLKTRSLCSCNCLLLLFRLDKLYVLRVNDTRADQIRNKKMKKSASNSQSSAKVERKTVEKNRRIRMKVLCSKLASLVPQHPITTSKELLSQQDLLDQAATHIKQLKEKIEGLKLRKEQALLQSKGIGTSSYLTSPDDQGAQLGFVLPVFELRNHGLGLEVILISGRRKNFMLYEVINILEEEGAEVLSASSSVIGDKIFHTLHAQVGLCRVGVETTRVRERLKELIR